MLRCAINLGLAYEAKLFVGHCVGSSPPADESRLERIKRLIEERLERIKRQIGEMISDYIGQVRAPALDLERVVAIGEPADVIAREADEREVDLIVMRTRHRPYAAPLGSTAETVSRTTLCPVALFW